MASKLRRQEDPDCASGPHLDSQWQEWLVESYVCLRWEPRWQHGIMPDSEVPAVPGGGEKAESAGGGTGS